MYTKQVFSFVVLALACVFAGRMGNKPERLGAALIAAGWCLTPLVEDLSSWTKPQYGMLGVDLLTLLLLVLLALHTGRLWPVCAAGFQLVAVLLHLIFWIAPERLYRAFYYANFAIGYLLLGALVGGCLLEAGAWSRLARFRSGRTAR